MQWMYNTNGSRQVLNKRFPSKTNDDWVHLTLTIPVKCVLPEEQIKIRLPNLTKLGASIVHCQVDSWRKKGKVVITTTTTDSALTKYTAELVNTTDTTLQASIYMLFHF